MQVFIKKPSIDLYPGIRVTKETELEYKNENVKQTVKDLVLHSVTKVKGDGFKSKYDTTIDLEDGDILIFEDEGRGYIKPVEGFVTIEEAIEQVHRRFCEFQAQGGRRDPPHLYHPSRHPVRRNLHGYCPRTPHYRKDGRPHR